MRAATDLSGHPLLPTGSFEKVVMSTKSKTTLRKKTSETKANQKKSTPKNIHVLPRADRWVIVSEGSQRPSSVHDTQLEAVETARKRAQQLFGQMIVHGRNGRIRERDSYGSDPLPPREPRKVLQPDAPPSTVSREAISRAVTKAIRESGSNSRSRARE
ncbi:MAG: DUF2188 domain-containing protein [Pyrinomonadaceae bacterium]